MVWRQTEADRESVERDREAETHPADDHTRLLQNSVSYGEHRTNEMRCE